MSFSGGIVLGITWLELAGIAVGLSMDAFAVSICKGLSIGRVRIRDMLWVGLWFGLFQALMPLGGWFLGSRFASLVHQAAPWIAFLLLAFIGGNMLREGLNGKEEALDGDLSPGTMFGLAVATSIDALATGIAFAAMGAADTAAKGPSGILAAVAFIGASTFVFSAAGVRIGNVFGSRYGKRAETVGGLVLIAIGLKILLEHLLG